MPDRGDLTALQIGTLQVLDTPAMPGTDRREIIDVEPLFHRLFNDEGTLTQLRSFRVELEYLVRFGYVRRFGGTDRDAPVIITSPGQAWLALHNFDLNARKTADTLTPDQERIHDLERLVRVLWASRRHHQA